MILILLLLIQVAIGQKSYDSYRLEKDIQEQINQIAQISDDTGLRLSANEDFYNWIID